MPRPRGPQYTPDGRLVYRAQLVLEPADDMLLDELARRLGQRSRAAVIRLLIRAEARRLALDTPHNAREGEKE